MSAVGLSAPAVTVPTLGVPAWAGVAAVGTGLLVLGYLLLAPRGAVVRLDRRRPGTGPGPGPLTAAAATATGLIAALLRRRGGHGAATLLDRAGVRMRVPDLVFLLVVGALAAGAVGLVLGGPVPALLLAAAVPVGARITLGTRITRRQRAFADQLDDALQLMASSLRAGHSLLQSLASVAREAEEPAAEEFARAINASRVGRDIAEALEETAARMASADFAWVAQAIAIQREVGGNLADVLDGVGHTIRERNQIRRQVKALSAEGKLSAVVLVALPFVVTAFLMMANPGYLAGFTQSLLGYTLIAVAVVLLLIGVAWMRKLVSFRF